MAQPQNATVRVKVKVQFGESILVWRYETTQLSALKDFVTEKLKLQANTFWLLYRDDDDEMITMDCQLDLNEAFEVGQKTKKLKIHVKKKDYVSNRNTIIKKEVIDLSNSSNSNQQIAFNTNTNSNNVSHQMDTSSITTINSNTSPSVNMQHRNPISANIVSINNNASRNHINVHDNNQQVHTNHKLRTMVEMEDTIQSIQITNAQMKQTNKLNTFNSQNTQLFGKMTITAMGVSSLIYYGLLVLFLYATWKWDHVATSNERPYNTAPYWFGNPFYNEFGEWYGIVIVIHVLVGTIAVISLIFPLITTKGSSSHIISGMFCVIFSIAVYWTGYYDCGWLHSVRGYHPCAYTLSDVPSRTAFSYTLYVQVIFYVPFFAETLGHAVAFAVYSKTGSTFGSRYLQCLLASSSLCSMISCITRVIFMAILMILFTHTDIKNMCDEFDLTVAALHMVSFMVEIPSLFVSYKNIKLISISMKSNGSLTRQQAAKVHGKNAIIFLAILFWFFIANISYKVYAWSAVYFYVVIMCTIYVVIIDSFRDKMAQFYQKLKRFCV